MKSIKQETGAYLDLGERIVAPSGPVGVVSTTAASLQEVACLLARQDVGVSRGLMASGSEQSGSIGVTAIEAGLQSLQADPATEVIVLVSPALPAHEAARVLDRVRASDKPTVACFVGNTPDGAWKAGAIPAARLDEAAMRAAAWIRGWDQALVSSWLEEEADRLDGVAAGLRSRIGPGRTRIYGVLACSVLAQEATMALAADGSAAWPAYELHVAPGLAERARRLHAALKGPAVAVILLDLWVDDLSDPDPAGGLAPLIQRRQAMAPGPTGQADSVPLVLAHVCGAGHSLARLGEQEARLRDLGAITAGSNASAAQLARLIVAGTSIGT